MFQNCMRIIPIVQIFEIDSTEKGTKTALDIHFSVIYFRYIYFISAISMSVCHRPNTVNNISIVKSSLE